MYMVELVSSLFLSTVDLTIANDTKIFIVRAISMMLDHPMYEGVDSEPKT